MNLIFKKIKLILLWFFVCLIWLTFNSTFAFVTINNLPEYNQIDNYWGNWTADYLHQFIRRWLTWQVVKHPDIHSFKDIPKIQQIHKKIERSLKWNLPEKIKILFKYLDNLLYNYADDLYWFIIKSNNKKIIHDKNENYKQQDNNSDINLNHWKDNIDQQLLKQYMCKEYNKTFIDFGCGTSPKTLNDPFVKETMFIERKTKERYEYWSKYQLNELYSYFDRKHFMNVIYNWLYKTVYLSSPAGFVKLFYYNFQYVNNAIPESYGTVFVNWQADIIAKWIQESLDKLGKFIMDNPQYNINKSSLFKGLINFLKTNYLNK